MAHMEARKWLQKPTFGRSPPLQPPTLQPPLPHLTKFVHKLNLGGDLGGDLGGYFGGPFFPPLGGPFVTPLGGPCLGPFVWPFSSIVP